MKYLTALSMAAFALLPYITSTGQSTTGQVPGDDFSLEGALELFKQSESPEHFEQLLNSPASQVNNLDLNGDGDIDYIRVFDRNEGNVHVFILQAVISEYESQDVAVIELEKLENGKAVLQIIGDEDIYGVETIIEPTRAVRTYAGTTTTNTWVNVWQWPSVYYIYSPYYTTWNSPWGWHRRPHWWSSWRPIGYASYYGYWQPYRPNYLTCHSHRVGYAYNIYHPYRTTSLIVRNKHSSQLDHYRTQYQHNTSGYGKNTSHNTHDQNNGRHESNQDHNGNHQHNNDHQEKTKNTSRFERSAMDVRVNDSNINNQNNIKPLETSSGQTRWNETTLPRSGKQETNQQRSHTSRHENVAVQSDEEIFSPANKSQSQPKLFGRHEKPVERSNFNESTHVKPLHTPTRNSASGLSHFSHSGSMPIKKMKRGS